MKLIKSKFSDRHRPKRELWQNKLRSDLKAGVHRPMFPNDNNDAMIYKEL